MKSQGESEVEILDTLNKDFFLNVLPHLFNKKDLSPFYSFLCGQGPGSVSYTHLGMFWPGHIRLINQENFKMVDILVYWHPIQIGSCLTFHYDLSRKAGLLPSFELIWAKASALRAYKLPSNMAFKPIRVCHIIHLIRLFQGYSL